VCALKVAASTNKEVEGHIPNYPNLPPQLICQLHDVTMHVRAPISFSDAFVRSNYYDSWMLSWGHDFLQADAETDEVYAQMTLQPLNPVRQQGGIHDSQHPAL
jgi:hypothetical protein